MAETWTLWDAELAYSYTSLTQGADAAPGRSSHNDGAEPMWGVAQVLPNGESNLHIFPHSTLEWRSAEYGIDPEDIDTLLDVILHEPFIPDPNDALARLDTRASKILRDTHGLPSCWTPGVPDNDRLQAHLTRIEAVKQHRISMEPAARRDRQDALIYVGSDRRADPHPLDPIRTGARLDPIRVSGRKLAVEWYRSNDKQLQTPTFYSKPPSTFVGMQPG